VEERGAFLDAALETTVGDVSVIGGEL